MCFLPCCVPPVSVLNGARCALHASVFLFTPVFVFCLSFDVCKQNDVYFRVSRFSTMFRIFSTAFRGTMQFAFLERFFRTVGFEIRLSVYQIPVHPTNLRTLPPPNPQLLTRAQRKAAPTPASCCHCTPEARDHAQTATTTTTAQTQHPTTAMHPPTNTDPPTPIHQTTTNITTPAYTREWIHNTWNPNDQNLNGRNPNGRNTNGRIHSAGVGRRASTPKGTTIIGSGT